VLNNYDEQKKMMQARLDVKTCETMLANIINLGTNCSPFESTVIVDKAKEVFCLGEYAETQVLQPGQMVWLATDEQEPPGKPIKLCRMKRIAVQYFSAEDDEVYRLYGLAAKRRNQILRVTTEAKDQGAYLSQEDLSRLLNSDIRTIRRDIKELKKQGIIVPTRGQQKDIGPGITHREKAVKLFLEGKEPLEIARQIKHSLHSVERYVDAFCRVLFCQNKTGNTLQTALIIGISHYQVKSYLALRDEYFTKKEYIERLGQIEDKGQAYWDSLDFKKNALLCERKNK
jgi:DNA-binding NarL/FixJ family response regulator